MHYVRTKYQHIGLCYALHYTSVHRRKANDIIDTGITLQVPNSLAVAAVSLYGTASLHYHHRTQRKVKTINALSRRHVELVIPRPTAGHVRSCLWRANGLFTLQGALEQGPLSRLLKRLSYRDLQPTLVTLFHQCKHLLCYHSINAHMLTIITNILLLEFLATALLP